MSGYVSLDVLGVLLSFFVGLAIGLLILRARYHRALEENRKRYNRKESELRQRWATSLAEAHEDNIRLVNQMDEMVERRVKEWWPDPRTFDEAWRNAEEMANRRKMRDAGRTHLPRSEAGPSSAVHRTNLTPEL